MPYLVLTLIALLITVGGVLLFKKLKILDRPGSDLKNTRKPVPTLQGIFVILVFVCGVSAVFPEYLTNPLFLGLLIPGVLVGAVEVFEELSYLGHFPKIPPVFRLFVHIFAAFLAIWIGGIGDQELVIGSTVYHIPDRMFTFVFMVWTMFCINAINWFDGIYAQGSGISAIGFLTIFLLIEFVVFQYYDVFTSKETLILVQNLSFFLFVISLIYTFIEYKPLALVRDVGIMFFGFAIAYLSILGGAKIGTLIVALSLPLFDAVWVGFYRLFIIKKNPLQGDYTHFHHRLLGLGFTRGEARAFIWIRSLVMMVLMLLQGANRLNKLIIFLMMATLFFGINAYLFLYKKLPCGLEIKKER